MCCFFKEVLTIPSFLTANEFIESDALGTISHYNGLPFNSLTAFQADCEGAMAVCGNARFGSGTHGYDVGGAGVSGWETIIIGHYENPNNYPSLLLGSIVESSSTSARIYAGSVVMTLSKQPHYEENTFRFDCADGVFFAPDKLCEDFFENAKNQVLRTSGVLEQGNDKTITHAELHALGNLALADYENKNIKTDAKILCFNLNCTPDDSVNISEINLTDALLHYDAVIVSISAKKITFADGAMLHNGFPIFIVPRSYPGNKLVRDFASRLIFNFPNADEVEMHNYSVIGSIIAPKAVVNTSGGSINGMLVANSLIQASGMELHAFSAALGEALWGLELKALTTNVTAIKQDALDHTALPGALFSLYRYNEDMASYDLVHSGMETSAGGELVIEDLPPGSYKLSETHAPLGYMLAEAAEALFEIKLNDKGEIIPVHTIYIENAKAKGHVKFSKMDSENREIKLAGAVFSLFVFNEQLDKYELVFEELTTSVGGELEIDDLLPGVYKLVETKAPKGYYLKDNMEIPFTISLGEDGEIIEPGLIEITNTKLGSVQVIKTDSESALITLSGAAFILKYLNPNSGEYETIRTGLVTDTDGCFILEDLEPGEYKLVEEKAPYRYALPTNPETSFTIEL